MSQEPTIEERAARHYAGIQAIVPMGDISAGPVTGTGRIQPGLLPAGRYVVLRHTGSYDGLISANAALQQWAQDQGLEFDMRDTPEGSAWGSRLEEYITDPSREPDPAKWETDVCYLFRG